MDFPHEGPFGDEMAAAFAELANSIAQEKGFIWKLWTENKETKESGGIYLFDTKANAEIYMEKNRKNFDADDCLEMPDARLATSAAAMAAARNFLFKTSGDPSSTSTGSSELPANGRD